MGKDGQATVGRESGVELDIRRRRGERCRP